jgi:hypothetical protein
MKRILQFSILGLAVVFGAAVKAQTVPLNQQTARVSPAWITDGVMVQLWLRAFTPEGTLDAARQRLPPVAEAGFTIIYLSPICLMDDDPRKEHWAPRQRKTENPRNRTDQGYERSIQSSARARICARLDRGAPPGLRVLLDIRVPALRPARC